MNESPQASTPPSDALRMGVDWVAKHWARVRLGHEGMMLEKIQRQNRIVEVNARNTMTGKSDDVTDWPKSEGDEMGVDIGDEIHNHYYPPSPATETSAKKPATTLAKAALAAALLAGGGGAGLGVPWLMGMFDKPAIERPAEPPQAETPQNAYGLSL